MGLLDRILPRWRKDTERTVEATKFQPLTAYAPIFARFGGSIYESDLVRAAINARATHISKLAITVSGTAKPKLRYRLKDAPNAFSTWSQTLYRISTILDIYNTCTIVPVLDADGDMVGIYPVLPDRCDMVEYKGEPWLRYKFANGQTAAIEFSRCGIMTKFQHESDFKGDSNRALNGTMDLIKIQQQGIQEAVKSTASYRFMARMTNFAKPEDIAKERKQFSEKNFGADSEAGGLLLFPNTYGDIQQIQSKPYIADAETMNLVKREICDYFGVNEDVLENKAFGDAWSAYYEGAIEPFAIQLSEVLTRMCFTENERGRGNIVMATANRLQYMSNNDKLNVSSQLLDRGILSLNEVREIWNLPPIEDGDTRVIRGEYYAANDKLAEGDESNE